MADKTIRFITAWNGYKPGDTLTDDEAVTDELVAGGLARDSAENDNSGATDLQAQITALQAALAQTATSYADDAAAEAGGVAIGGLYNVAGAVTVRLT